MAKELKIIQDFYDFTLWVMNHIKKFPRHQRYSIGRDIEARLNEALGLLLKAKFRKAKKELLNALNIELELLRFQLRLSKDLGILSVKSYGYGSKCLVEIGSQVGGWLKSL